MLEAKKETSRANRVVGLIMLALIGMALTMAWLTRSGADDADQQEAAEVSSQATEQTDGDADGAGGPDDDGAASASGGTADEGTDDAGADPDDDATSDDGDPGDADDPVATLPDRPEGQPYLDATLSDNVFVLSGTVPSEELKQAIEAQAELAYAPFASSELQVDATVGDADWLTAAPQVVGLLPMITDGTIRMQDEQVYVTGRSPTQPFADLFQQTVGQLTELPVEAVGITITNLSPPRFVATVENGQVQLEGEIPSQQMLETFLLGAAAVYGTENVTSTMTVDDSTHTSFWNYTIPGVFELFAPFPSYQFSVENGVTTGTMQGGVLFDLNSSSITPEAAEVLNVGVALLARDRLLTMAVVGHTDDRGPEDVNERLSLARAQAVTGYLTAAGIDAERLTADGRGEAEPIASNDTAEGRAFNRRVEFQFG